MKEEAGLPIETRRLSIASGPLTLEAAFHRPAGLEPHGLLVACHPHPQYGGTMDNNVVAALCGAALQEGMATLRFNFRGVGASTGAFDDGKGEQSDVHAALAAAAALPGGDELCLAGYSFGAWMAALSSGGRDATPRALILISPPVHLLSRATLRACSMPCLLLVGDLDPICPAAELQEVAAGMTPPASIRIVEGADHTWLGYEDELRDTAGGFLRWTLPASS